MKYLKLFEEMKIGGEKEFPFEGHDLSPRERKIITDLVPGFYLNKFTIKVDDHYYYTKFSGFYTYYNVFDNFNDLKDYVLFKCYIDMNKPEEFLELLKTSKLDPSFDTNDALRWAYRNRYTEIFKHLLSDHRVDPTLKI